MKTVGSWIVLGNVVGGSALLGTGCGPEGAAEGEPTPDPTETPSPTPTPTADPCGCESPSGAATPIQSADIPVNGLALEPGNDLFICHDEQGFYAMTAKCSHTGCPFDTSPNAEGSSYRSNDLSYGIHCGCHGSDFDANGGVTGGPATSDLIHYRMSIAEDDTIWVDKTPPFADPSCRCT